MFRRAFIHSTGILAGGLCSGGLTRAANEPQEGLALSGPSLLSRNQKLMCASLAEHIIPTTDTPGAIDAGVPAFIELMVSEWYTPTERRIFLDGLAALDAHCLDTHGQAYLHCDAAQQAAGLAWLETLALDHEQTRQKPLTLATLTGSAELDEHAPFFSKLKELVVVGYYRSETGATRELIYLPIPMRYTGESDLDESGGRQYTW